MVQVYIALGSNLNTPTEQLNSALEAISALPNTELKSCLLYTSDAADE